MARVAELGMPALAVTDHDGLYGAVRFYQAAKAAGIKPILGVELTTEGGHHLTVVAASKRGYGNLSRMVTAGQFRVLREARGGTARSFASAQDDNKGVTAGQFRVLREARGGTARSFAGAQDDNKGVAAGQSRVLREAEAAGSGDPALQNGNGRAGDKLLPNMISTIGAQWRKAPCCSFSTLAKCAADVIALSGCRIGEVSAAVRREDMEGARRAVRRYQEIFGKDNFFIELMLEEGERDRMQVAKLAALAQEMEAPTVATANVHYLTPQEATIQDVLACIQTLTRRSEWHPIRRLGAERYLKSAEEMARAFAHHPEALCNTIRIAERCEVDLGLGELHFPHFRMRDGGGFGTEVPKHRTDRRAGPPWPPAVWRQPALPDWSPKPDEEVEGESAERLLEWLCWQGARRRYGVAPRTGLPRGKRRACGDMPALQNDNDGQEAPKPAFGGPGWRSAMADLATSSCPTQVASRLRHELRIIRELGLCEYFLVVWDIVEEARARGIRCSGRGSAADSLVSYVLGITEVDPIAARLLFERFLNPERRGMPDIDIDFDSRRRDEMLEYVARRYGVDHTGMVATINTYNAALGDPRGGEGDRAAGGAD